MTSIPRLDTPVGTRLDAIPGSVPHPLDLPKGCKFAPRCKYATAKCMEEEPKLEEVEGNHSVRCFIRRRRGAMQQNNQSKKVLLKITDLKQWFRIKKTKLFQKEQL